MIRINLLTAERVKAPKKLTFQSPQMTTAGCVAVLVVAVLGIGGWFWTLRSQSAQLDRDITKAQAEVQRLKSVLERVKSIEDRKAQLSQRVVLIEDLRKGQKGPVHMLDEVSKALPPMLWLTRLQQTGAEMIVEGLSTTQTAVSDFVTNLEASGYFKKSIEIILTKTMPLSQPPGELVQFSLRAQFQTPGEAKPAEATPVKTSGAKK
jgi:type IV pilus assembly protein PilN